MKTIRLSLLLMGLMVAMMASAQGRCRGFVFDTDGYVNVRKSASTSSAIVRQVKNNTTLFYSPTGGNWYQVSLTAGGAAIGYVYWNRIAMSSDDLGNYVVTDPDGYTNVRQGTSTSTAVVKRMNRGNQFRGTPVYVNGKASKWIGVLDASEKLIGFVYATKVRNID